MWRRKAVKILQLALRTLTQSLQTIISKTTPLYNKFRSLRATVTALRPPPKVFRSHAGDRLPFDPCERRRHILKKERVREAIKIYYWAPTSPVTSARNLSGHFVTWFMTKRQTASHLISTWNRKLVCLKKCFIQPSEISEGQNEEHVLI